MDYYPYMNYGYNGPRRSLFSSIKNINFSNVLDNTQRTLNIINQAIPIFYQIKPIWNNTKTVFKIMSAINTPDNNRSNQSVNRQETVPEIKTEENQPTFFL